MKYRLYPIFFLVTFVAVSCKTTRNAGISKRDDGKLEMVFVQVNDVYEIAPLDGGKIGGMARVATIKKQYLGTNPNTLLVIAGDFVSPSVYNSLRYKNKAIRGKQMIDAMNSAGMNLAVFGNHEFDINESELQERMNESDFQWVASNTFHKVNGKEMPFEKTHNNITTSLPKTYIMQFRDADGTTAKIGFIGLTLPFNKASYVSYSDPLATAKQLFGALKDSCDAVVAITHQAVEDDIILAKELPGLAVILGGHEHDMRFEKTGNVYITKAHANARSAYIVRLLIDKNKKSTSVKPELKMLDESVAFDSATALVVKKWMEIGDSNYASLGFNVKEVLISKGDTLDGRETAIRTRSTNLTQIVSAAMADACPQADVVMYNSGSIRLDDMLAPPITQYDIIRSLPFGGAIRESEMKGKLLIKVLDAGRKNIGTGGYLQYSPVTYNASNNTWTLNNQPLDPEKIYKVALAEFLITGKEANLDFLTKDNPDMVNVKDADTSVSSSKTDIRLAVVRYLEKKAGKSGKSGSPQE